MTYPALSLPYLQAAGDGGPRPSTQVIVIHATDNTASAHAESVYAQRRADKTSAHAYIDGRDAYQALPWGHIAYGCLWHGNRISVQAELCGLSGRITDATMRRAAPIVAAWCHMYSIPVRKVTAEQVADGVRGICGHVDITGAFPQDNGDHTDPGAFNWSAFLAYVAEAYRGQHPAPTAPAVPKKGAIEMDLKNAFFVRAATDPTVLIGNGLVCRGIPNQKSWDVLRAKVAAAQGIPVSQVGLEVYPDATTAWGVAGVRI